MMVNRSGDRENRRCRWPVFAGMLSLLLALCIVAAPVVQAAGRTFDVEVSYHGNPQSSGDKEKIENILNHFADGVYESTEGVHAIGKIRVYRNGSKDKTANIVWNWNKDTNSDQTTGWPSAPLNGYGKSGYFINMFDKFGSHNFLDDEIDGGYTLAHEWGHYAYGLKDEYSKRDKDCDGSASPCKDDDPVSPSIMNSQWQATLLGGSLIDSRWLNFSIANHGGTAANGFDDFENTKNTAQQRKYGESGWETLARKPNVIESIINIFGFGREHYPELAAVAPSGTNIPKFDASRTTVFPSGSRDNLEIIWMDGATALMLVIDNSGSMGYEANKMDNAKNAAKLLVDAVSEGTKLGVIAFNGYPTTISAITEITNQASRDAIKAQIDILSPYDGTAVGAAAQAALDALLAQNVGDSAKVVFLLSDGVSGDDSLAPVPAYQNEKIPIYTFSYGSDADANTLGLLASMTGGKTYVSPTTMSAVSQALQDALAASTTNTGVAGGWSAAPTSGSSIPITIDSSISALQVRIAYSGTASQTVFKLISPTGVQFDPSSVQESGGETILLFSVDNSLPGIWTLDAKGVTGNVPFTYQASATPTGDTFVLSSNTYNGAQTIQYPAPFVITARLVKGLPIAGATVTAHVTAPDGSVTVLSLLDDGKGADSVAGDGAYAASIDYRQSGSYSIEIHAIGIAGTAHTTVKGLEMSPPPPGVVVTIPSDTPVVEGFERFERFQVEVKGVLQDDHGDTPAAATLIPADNSLPVPGRIDYVGDPDIFSFSVPAGVSNLVVRVAGFIGNMDPQLTIYAADGSTVIASGTLSDAKSEGGYLALPVMVTAGQTVFAEVENINSDTGAYQISVGQPISKDMVTFVITGNGDANGTVSCQSPANYGENSVCSITPATGYTLATFTDNGSNKLSSVVNKSYTISNVQENHVVAATFIAINPVRVNGDAPLTTTTKVTLTINKPDTKYLMMCLSFNGTKWGTWFPVAPTVATTLPTRDGVKTVYVKFRTPLLKESAVYSDSIILDSTPPVGSITINAGAARTKIRNVTLTLAATGAPASMQLSLDGGVTWGIWETFASTKNGALVGASGTKKVSVRLKDSAGNVSAVFSDTIALSL